MTTPWDHQSGIYLWDFNIPNGPDWRKVTLDDFLEMFGAGVNYTMAYAYNGSNKIEYLGMAEPGTSKASAGWKIMKYTYSGNLLTDIQFANGNRGFGHVWNNYASYSYS